MDLRMPLVWFYSVAAVGAGVAAVLALVRIVQLFKGTAGLAERSGGRTWDRDLVALLGFVGMFALMAIRVPIGIAMGMRVWAVLRCCRASSRG